MREEITHYTKLYGGSLVLWEGTQTSAQPYRWREHIFWAIKTVTIAIIVFDVFLGAHNDCILVGADHNDQSYYTDSIIIRCSSVIVIKEIMHRKKKLGKLSRYTVRHSEA